MVPFEVAEDGFVLHGPSGVEGGTVVGVEPLTGISIIVFPPATDA